MHPIVAAESVFAKLDTEGTGALPIEKFVSAWAAPAPAPAETGPFAFASGLPDCCTASPDLYKVIADLPGVARLVEMIFPPGAKDLPHEHPVHNMYFVTDVKLKISGPPTPTTLGEEGGVAEVPAGAAPIFPAMAHQARARSVSRLTRACSWSWRPV